MAKSAPSKSETKKLKNENPVPNTQPEAPTTDLLELFLNEIRDIYWAENHLVKALPKMQKAASSAKLAKAIGDHLAVTKTHVTRLEQIFDLLGKKPKAKKCDAMDGLSKEAEGVLEDTRADSATRDVGIILCSQKVEHYEIAAYGGLAEVARALGLREVSDLLSQTLADEKDADATLSSIAATINAEAAGG